MNTADWIALAIIGIAVVCAVIYIVKHRNSCGGSCGNCPYSNSCGKISKDKRK